MKISQVISHLENRFPLSWQEDFDNCGVQCGDKEQDITGALVCFDFSEAVIDEAIKNNRNFIVSHHPLLLRKGICKIEPTHAVGKILCKALENRLVLYSMHTNMDSAANGGNYLFADKLELLNQRVLVPKQGLYKKLVVFVPKDYHANLKKALFKAGCGMMGNYSDCSFSSEGQGSYMPLSGSQPFIGKENIVETVEEMRLEMIFPSAAQRKVTEVIYRVHPYEEPVFDIFSLENSVGMVGLGRVGDLKVAMSTTDFFHYLKQKLNLKVVKYHGNINRMVRKVAVCGGSGASFIPDALQAGADVYVTGDVKYHDFFAVDDAMIIADIGHYEGEHFIKEIIYNELKENFTTFATSKSSIDKSEVIFI